MTRQSHPLSSNNSRSSLSNPKRSQFLRFQPPSILPKIQSASAIGGTQELSLEEINSFSSKYGQWNKCLNTKLLDALKKQKRINDYWLDCKKNHKPTEDRVKSVEVALRKQRQPIEKRAKGFKRVTLEQLSMKAGRKIHNEI